ncbi:hypothetical protein B296_00026393 [Ensete ventricosum]|uniref:Uncharacterized protein n=1 Tax=Ensete ventricosum TaxID=4639 RepID=A0A427ARQ5_ENSVE|nr:hypothetical protein B296_00026393 [Ensete ventricosum]
MAVRTSLTEISMSITSVCLHIPCVGTLGMTWYGSREKRGGGEGEEVEKGRGRGEEKKDGHEEEMATCIIVGGNDNDVRRRR